MNSDIVGMTQYKMKLVSRLQSSHTRCEESCEARSANRPEGPDDGRQTTAQAEGTGEGETDHSSGRGDRRRGWD